MNQLYRYISIQTMQTSFSHDNANVKAVLRKYIYVAHEAYFNSDIQSSTYRFEQTTRDGHPIEYHNRHTSILKRKELDEGKRYKHVCTISSEVSAFILVVLNEYLTFIADNMDTIVQYKDKLRTIRDFSDYVLANADNEIVNSIVRIANIFDREWAQRIPEFALVKDDRPITGIILDISRKSLKDGDKDNRLTRNLLCKVFDVYMRYIATIIVTNLWVNKNPIKSGLIKQIHLTVGRLSFIELQTLQDSFEEYYQDNVLSKRKQRKSSTRSTVGSELESTWGADTTEEEVKVAASRYIAKKPIAKEPKAKEPKAKEPKAKEPKAKETKAKETKVKETKVKETKVKVTKVKATKVKKSNLTKEELNEKVIQDASDMLNLDIHKDDPNYPDNQEENEDLINDQNNYDLGIPMPISFSDIKYGTNHNNSPTSTEGDFDLIDPDAIVVNHTKRVNIATDNNQEIRFNNKEPPSSVTRAKDYHSDKEDDAKSQDDGGEDNQEFETEDECDDECDDGGDDNQEFETEDEYDDGGEDDDYPRDSLDEDDPDLDLTVTPTDNK